MDQTTLAELQAVATGADAALDAQAAPLAAPDAAEVVPAGPNQAEQIGGLLQMGVMMAAPALPFLPQCYTPEAINNIATAAAAVCEKRGWTIGDVMTPEVVLAVAAVPPTVQAYVMFRAWQAERREMAEQAEREQLRASAHTAHNPAPMQPGA